MTHTVETVTRWHNPSIVSWHKLHEIHQEAILYAYHSLSCDTVSASVFLIWSAAVKHFSPLIACITVKLPQLVHQVSTYKEKNTSRPLKCCTCSDDAGWRSSKLSSQPVFSLNSLMFSVCSSTLNWTTGINSPWENPWNKTLNKPITQKWHIWSCALL